jgi:hypothetical protein
MSGLCCWSLQQSHGWAVLLVPTAGSWLGCAVVHALHNVVVLLCWSLQQAHGSAALLSMLYITWWRCVCWSLQQAHGSAALLSMLYITWWRCVCCSLQQAHCSAALLSMLYLTWWRCVDIDRSYFSFSFQFQIHLRPDFLCPLLQSDSSVGKDVVFYQTILNLLLSLILFACYKLFSTPYYV